jgi:glycosyltransferase involved in cell wall biosynthesis
VLVRKLRTASELARFRRVTGLRFQIVLEVHDIPSLLDRPFAEVEALLQDHAPPGGTQSRGPRLAEERILHGIDGVICITDASRRLLARSGELVVPMVTVRSGVDLRAVGEFEAQAPAPDTHRGQVVMYAGQLWPWKGVEVLVQAMAELPAPVHLEVLGGDVAGARTAEMAALAGEAGVAGRVRFRGFVPHGEIHSLYRRADCLVLPNRRTVRGGFFSSPIKLFEYMASGVPTVASDLPSTREMLRQRENAILVEPDSPAALAAGLLDVLENRTLARKLANQAKADVQEFSWERRTDRLVQFFEMTGRDQRVGGG